MTTVRLATDNDLAGIMEVERAEFGTEMSTTPEIMRSRIEMCNGPELGCFWVAQNHDRIVGTMILEPTNITPETCTSWSAATSNGTLRDTIDPKGRNIYVVSLGVLECAPPDATPLLVKHSFEFWQKRGGQYMFCSRIPSYKHAHEKTGVSIDDYWQQKRADGSPQDWMLHEYWSMTGRTQPDRLLRDGFPPDEASEGHAVLFVADDPNKALTAIDERLQRAKKIATAHRN